MSSKGLLSPFVIWPHYQTGLCSMDPLVTPISLLFQEHTQHLLPQGLCTLLPLTARATFPSYGVGDLCSSIIFSASSPPNLTVLSTATPPPTQDSPNHSPFLSIALTSPTRISTPADFCLPCSLLHLQSLEHCLTQTVNTNKLLHAELKNQQPNK